MTTNLYARAYVRGLNADLVAAGSVVYPTKIAMDIAADAVADNLLQGVDFLGLRGGVPTKLAMDAVDGLLQISDDLCKQAGGYAPQLNKVAGEANAFEVARYEAFELLKQAEAAAANPQKTEPVSTGTDKNPAATNSAPNSSETGVAVDAPAKADGADGVPSSAVEGTEHAIGGHGTTPANAKIASFARRLTAKIAATSAENPKTIEAIPATADSATGVPSKIVAKKDGAKGVPASAVEGQESAQKTASFLARVEKVATAAIPYLPGDLPEYAQLAHVRALSKLGSAEDQGKYLFLMYNAYGMPEDKAVGFADEYVKRASDMGVDEDDDDGDDDDKKPDGDGDADDGSSDAAVAAALDDAAGEIEAGKKEEEAEEATKTASANSIDSAVNRLRRTLG